jgi:ribosomal protein S18 acetylase RimI-like enzyme
MSRNVIGIRNFIDEDYPHISNIWEETGMGGAHRGDNLDSIHSTLRNGGRLLVMLCNEKVIGTSWISNDGRRLYLHHFGILPAFQGKGYSKFLLRESLKFARKRKLQIKLEVHQDNTIAINLYKKAGFDYLGDYHVYIIRSTQK